MPDACWTLPTVASPKESLPAPRGEQASVSATVPNTTICAEPLSGALYLPSQSKRAGNLSWDPIPPRFAEYDIPLRLTADRRVCSALASSRSLADE